MIKLEELLEAIDINECDDSELDHFIIEEGFNSTIQVEQLLEVLQKHSEEQSSKTLVHFSQALSSNSQRVSDFNVSTELSEETDITDSDHINTSKVRQYPRI